MNIIADSTLPNLKTLFPRPFRVSTYDNQSNLPDLIKGKEILICRSTLRVNASLLENSSIKCVATASSGTDHIDKTYLADKKITLFDAKGTNARAVADYVLSSLAVLQQKEYLNGKKAAVLGLGKVGSQVLKRLTAAGMDVIWFDPLIDGLSLIKGRRTSLDDIFKCDLLCIHPNLHDIPPFSTKNLIDNYFLSQLKPGVCIINASRGGIINEDDLLNLSSPIIYCTDVFLNEPEINPRIVKFATLCTPHIAGHSIEAKNNALLALSIKIHQHYGLNPVVENSERQEFTQSNPEIKNLHSVHDSMDPAVTSREFELGLNSGQYKNWQENILNIYNPLNETNLLKSAANKKTAFLLLRKAHNTRHDFNCYDQTGLNLQTKLLFGY